MIVPGSVNPLLMAVRSALAAYRGTLVDTSTQTTFTFTGSFGPESAGRVIAVMVASGGNSNTPVSAMSIGGVTASFAVNAYNSGSGATLFAIAYAVVPTNSNQSISVTVPGGKIGMAISIYSLSGLSSPTPVSAQTSQANSVTSLSVGSVNAEAGGILLVGAMANSTTLITNTWSSGVTEDYDGNYANSYSMHFAGHEVLTATINPRTITATFTGTSQSPVMGAAVWK